MERSTHRLGSHRGLRAASAVLIIVTMYVNVIAGPNDMCIPDISGGLTGVPNTADGVIEGYTGPVCPNIDDNGWERATRVNLSADMGSTTASKMQLGRDANFVYLGLLVATPNPGINDTFVLTFSTDGNSANDWRLHIKPFDNVTVSGDRCNEPPNAVAVWRNSDPATGWNTGAGPTFISAGNAIFDGIHWSRSGINWSLEMRIPIEHNIANANTAGGNQQKIYFPNSGVFQMYADLLSASTITAMATPTPTPMTTQDPWPAGVVVQPINTNLLTRNTPDKANWGNVSFNSRPACDGVSLAWGDIGVEFPANSNTIVTDMKRFEPVGGFTEANMAACQAHPVTFNPGDNGPPNTFIARPFNNMSNTAQVSATFKIADWGIPGVNEWTNIGEGVTPVIGVSGNPTSELPINSGVLGKLTATWALTYRWSCIYSFNSHQCMQVNLDSSDPNTRFNNKSMQRNMDFVAASRFTRDARISGDQGDLPQGQTRQRFVIAVETDQQGRLYPQQSNAASVSDRPPTGSPRLHSKELASLAERYLPRKTTNVAVWIARGFVRTSKFININGTDYEYVRRVGDFGYVAGHSGNISGWRFEFTGNGLTRAADGLYTLDVAPGEHAVVNTVIEAVDAGSGSTTTTTTDPTSWPDKRWGFSLHAGANFPHGSFDNLYDPGFSFNVDLEYRLTKYFSLEGLYGFHRFRGTRFGSVKVADLNLHQFSLDGKAYLTNTTVRPFVNFGGGAYKFDPGSTHGGVNAGGGLQFNVTPTFAVEGAYNFHSVFTFGNATKFSTLQGGVRFRF